MARGGKREGAGRPKGSQDRNNKLLREMILQALDEQPGGGVAYLKARAADEPKAFMGLLGRVLPLQVTGDSDDEAVPVKVEVAVRNGRKNADPQ